VPAEPIGNAENHFPQQLADIQAFRFQGAQTRVCGKVCGQFTYSLRQIPPQDESARRTTMQRAGRPSGIAGIPEMRNFEGNEGCG
jgi:hypothetical protein